MSESPAPSENPNGTLQITRCQRSPVISWLSDITQHGRELKGRRLTGRKEVPAVHSFPGWGRSEPRCVTPRILKDARTSLLRYRKSQEADALSAYPGPFPLLPARQLASCLESLCDMNPLPQAPSHGATQLWAMGWEGRLQSPPVKASPKHHVGGEEPLGFHLGPVREVTLTRKALEQQCPPSHPSFENQVSPEWDQG